MSEDLVSVRVSAQLTDLTLAKKDADDLAWDHAKVAALASGVSMGDPEFEELYKKLHGIYDGLADNLEFLMYNALIVLKSMLNSQLICIDVETPVTDTDLALALGHLAHTIVSSYAWMIAGHGINYPKNNEMPDVGVTFKFPSEDIIFTQE